MGRVRLTDLVTAQDVGRVINPQGLEGQSEGRSLYCAGMGIWEDTLLTEAGVMLTPNSTTYLIGTAPPTTSSSCRWTRTTSPKAAKRMLDAPR